LPLKTAYIIKGIHKLKYKITKLVLVKNFTFVMATKRALWLAQSFSPNGVFVKGLSLEHPCCLLVSLGDEVFSQATVEFYSSQVELNLIILKQHGICMG